MNGWSGKTTDLKQYLVKNLDFDVLSLCESFLTDKNVINIDGYTWFGTNRLSIDKRATRGSGGVGFLIKNNICNHFQIEKLDSSSEGILWLKLKNKENEHEEIMICSCYCPPPSSSKGSLSQEFFDALLTNVCMFYDVNCPCIIMLELVTYKTLILALMILKSVYVLTM